jgi:hypothetical protein
MYLADASRSFCNGPEANSQEKRNAMKILLTVCSLLLLTPSVTFAASQGGVTFPNAVRVGKDSLPAGRYEVHWQPGSSDGPVTISGNGHKVSVPAKLAATNGPDEVLMHREGNDQVVDGFTVKAVSFSLATP